MINLILLLHVKCVPMVMHELTAVPLEIYS